MDFAAGVLAAHTLRAIPKFVELCTSSAPQEGRLTPRQTGSAAKARYFGPDRGPRPEVCSCRRATTSGRTRRELVPRWEMGRIETEYSPPQRISQPHCQISR